MSILAVATAVVVAPTAAHASTCSSGWTCAWEHLSYNTRAGETNGRTYASQKGLNKWNDLGFMDVATSVSNNGKACQRTRYYESWGWADSRPSGSTFTLYSMQRTGENWKDPDLRNGAGYDGQGVDFNDDIAGHEFFMCY